MSDIFVTAHTPTLGVGRALRTYALCRALAEHGPLDIVYTAFGAAEPSPEFTGNPAIRLHAVHPSRGARRALAYLAARRFGLPEALARGLNVEIEGRVRELLAEREPGRIIADGMAMWVALRKLGVPVIYNAHNLESAFQHELGAEGYGSQEKVARFERRLLRAAGESWMVSAADIEGARRLVPGARLRYVPNVVDCAAIDPVTPPPRTQRALLVADYTWPPNAQAADWLTAEVMPRVWEALPQARLALVGRGLHVEAPPDDRIEIRGFVEDLEEPYREAAAVVVPLLAGGGSPLKFVEGLAHGLPVVATPRAAKGLDLVPGTHYLEGEDAATFADALVGVLRDGADGIGAAGRAQVERKYSIATLTELVAPTAP